MISSSALTCEAHNVQAHVLGQEVVRREHQPPVVKLAFQLHHRDASVIIHPERKERLCRHAVGREHICTPRRETGRTLLPAVEQWQKHKTRSRVALPHGEHRARHPQQAPRAAAVPAPLAARPVQRGGRLESQRLKERWRFWHRTPLGWLCGRRG